MTRPPTATRGDRSSRLVALALLVVVALLAVGCSDAHSDLERQLSDTGTDPDVVTIYAPQAVTPALQALGAAFGVDHPGTRFVFVTDSTGGLKRKMANQGAVSMWVDQTSVITDALGDPRVAAPAQPFGTDSIELVVARGNPLGITGLEVFGAKQASIRPALCVETQPCGLIGRKLLERAGVTPVNRRGTADGAALVKGLAEGRVDVGLAYQSDVAVRADAVTVLPLAQPPVGTVSYSALQLSANPKVAAFASWMASDAARAIVAQHGITPTTTGAS